MYNTTAEYKTAVQKLPQNFRMKITVEFSEESSINIECENSRGGVNILPENIFDADFDESAFGTGGFKIGSAAATMFSVRIHNENEKYSKNEMSSAVLKPQLALYDSDGTIIDYVKVGTFFTRSIIVSGTELKLDCSDRMDDAAGIPYVPLKIQCSLYEIGTRIANILNTTFTNNVDDLSMLKSIIDDSVFEGYSLRQVISCIAEVTGSFAIFNYEGELELKWFTESGVELREDWSKKAIVLNGNTFTTDGNPVKVTGVSVISGEESKAFIGTEEYLLEIVDNPIADLFPEETASAVYERVKDTVYIPSVWDRLGGDPSIQVGDIVTVIDNKESYNPEHYSEYNKYKLYVSQKNWKYNGGLSESYEAQALPKQNKNTGMTVSKRMSRLAKQIVETEKDLTAAMDRRQLALLAFNNAIAGSMGLYSTVVTDEAGAEIVYFHDKPNLSDSKIVYTYGKNGFAWTNSGYKGDATLWQYGFDKNGNAILNAIYAYSLSADVITSGILKSKNGASWINLNDGTFSFGKKALFGLLNVPVLSLNDDGDISMFGRICSQLNKGYSFGFWGNGVSIRDSEKTSGSQELLSIDASWQDGGICFTAAGDSITPYHRRHIHVTKDSMALEHGSSISSFARLVLRSKLNTIGGCLFELEADGRGIKADSYNRVTLYNSTSHSAYLGSDGTFYVENIDLVSDRDRKVNIRDKKPRALNKLKDMKFYSYNLKEKGSRVNMGVMADEAPKDILGSDGKSINLYSYISYIAKAVQELNGIVEEQAKEITALKEEIKKYKEETK